MVAMAAWRAAVAAGMVVLVGMVVVGRGRAAAARAAAAGAAEGVGSAVKAAGRAAGRAGVD